MNNFDEKEWPVRPYSKSELAQAYAPDISTKAALKRLALWMKINLTRTQFLITIQTLTHDLSIQLLRYHQYNPCSTLEEETFCPSHQSSTNSELYRAAILLE